MNQLKLILTACLLTGLLFSTILWGRNELAVLEPSSLTSEMQQLAGKLQNNVTYENTAGLEILNYEVNKKLANMTDAVTIQIQITNPGLWKVSQREINFYLSTDLTLDKSDICVGQICIDLEADQTETPACTFKPNSISALENGQPYYLLWWMPVNNQLYASNTAELAINCSSEEKLSEPGVPTEFSLSQNYPNPFNPETQIRFSLKESAVAELKIYNLHGQLINTLVNTELPAGVHTVRWNGKDAAGKDVAGGVYLYALKAGKYKAYQRMTYLK